MKTVNFVKRNRCQDSVTLIQAAVRLREVAGIEDASLVISTDPNKEILLEVGLLESEGHTAGPNDLTATLQREKLEAVGAAVATSNAGAARLAVSLVNPKPGV
jgi:hypothetical protein